MTAAPGEQLTDFSRTFLHFSSTRVNHTPRLAVAATCTIRPRDGSAPRTFYMTRTCVGEAMYVDQGLIYEPVMEFRLIAAPRDQFLLIKRFADGDHDVIQAFAFGETMPTQDGRGAKMNELDVMLQRCQAVEPITSYAGFRDALLGGRAMVGRTHYKDERTGEAVTLEYPAETVNVGHDRSVWQVDAGPIVMPCLPALDTIPVARLRPAYLVYNRFDYGEYVVERRRPLGTGCQTHGYGDLTALRCRHELFEVL